MPVQLRTYYSDDRGDNFSTATPQGEQDALIAGYVLIREEATVFAEGEQLPGMVPLRLFWNPNRGDNFTTATNQGVQDAQAAGYQEIRIEGYVYPEQQPDTVPLRLFWDPVREDNFTTATDQGVQDALAAGYLEIRIEGWAVPNPGAVRVVRGQADRDFGGGKHGTANATLDAAGTLTVNTTTWTNPPFQGFTMGVKVLLLDENRTVIGETSGDGPGPYGVNGRLVPDPDPQARSERTDIFRQNFDPALAAEVTYLAIYLFWAPRWRIGQIVSQVVAVVVEIYTWVDTFCDQNPDLCEDIRRWLEVTFGSGGTGAPGGGFGEGIPAET